MVSKGFCHIHRHIRGINEDAEVLALQELLANNPDIAAGTFYTKFMIEENDTMDEVAKAGSSTGKT